MNTHNEIWIGLVGIYPLEGNIYITEDQGAYVNILLFASSIEDYKVKVIDFLCDNKFIAFEIEDIEKFSERSNSFNIDNSLVALSNSLQNTKQPQMSTLHVFDKEE